MDSFEFNKMAGALLGALVLTMGLGIATDVLFYHPAPTKPGDDLPVPKATASAAAPAAPVVPLPVLLAKANPQKGEDDTKVCQACHNFEKGAGPKIGPPLYGVLGRPVASVAGFDYSDALKKKGGDWTYDKLFQWIDDPQGYAPGTKMAFAGEPDPQKRADIISYLRTLSDKPLPLPPVPAAAPPAKKAAAAAPAPGAVVAAAPAAAAPAAAAPAAGAPAAATPAASAAQSDAQLMAEIAKADVQRGQQDTMACQICHNFDKGGGAKIGPPLYGVVGRAVASVPGFDYSDSLKKIGGVWTFDKLTQWIKDPQAYAPGTKMTFAGEPSAKRRVDILAYLRTLSDKPVPLTPAAAAATGGAPAATQPSSPSGAPSSDSVK